MRQCAVQEELWVSLVEIERHAKRLSHVLSIDVEVEGRI
jgi:hypothetical protein